MRIRNYNYHKGDLILNLVDNESKFLGNLIVSDTTLIKELRRTDLSKIQLNFKYE